MLYEVITITFDHRDLQLPGQSPHRLLDQGRLAGAGRRDEVQAKDAPGPQLLPRHRDVTGVKNASDGLRHGARRHGGERNNFV